MKFKSSDYKCLSKKDVSDKKQWFAKSKKKKKKPKKKVFSSLDLMADQLKDKPYAEFLNSKYWSIIRKKVLIRDGRKCVVCGGTDNLQVHHDNYKNHFREHNHLKDLMTLCRIHHKEHHYSQN